MLKHIRVKAGSIKYRTMKMLFSVVSLCSYPSANEHKTFQSSSTIFRGYGIDAKSATKTTGITLAIISVFRLVNIAFACHNESRRNMYIKTHTEQTSVTTFVHMSQYISMISNSHSFV